MRECARCRQLRPGPLLGVDGGLEVCEGCVTMHDHEPPQWWESTMEYVRATYDVEAPSVKLN